MEFAMKPRTHRPRSRRWLGFFLVLAVLAGTAIVVPIAYNLSIQLRPEQLADARHRWETTHPANYDLEYLVKSKRGEEETEDPYFVAIRSGRVLLAIRSGDALYIDPSLSVIAGSGISALSSEDPRYFGVPALFDEIEAMLRRDEAAGRRNFATAKFDEQDGHPYHYVHRARDRKERVEWNIKMTRVPSNPRQ